MRQIREELTFAKKALGRACELLVVGRRVRAKLGGIGRARDEATRKEFLDDDALAILLVNREVRKGVRARSQRPVHSETRVNQRTGTQSQRVLGGRLM